MDLGEKLKKSREAKGFTQKELAEKSGVSQGTISLLESNNRRFMQDSIEKILEILGLKEEDFFGSGLSPVAISHEIHPRPIPVISWVHAGAFVECFDSWPPGVSGEGDPVYSYVKTGPNAFGLKVSGDSMFPRIMQGDIVIVDPAIRCDNGSICVVWVNADVSIKLFWDHETEIVLKPMNDKYPDTIIQKDSKVDFRVIGKVVDVKMKL